MTNKRGESSPGSFEGPGENTRYALLNYLHSLRPLMLEGYFWNLSASTASGHDPAQHELALLFSFGLARRKTALFKTPQGGERRHPSVE
jgi:hypothetical protein